MAQCNKWPIDQFNIIWKMFKCQPNLIFSPSSFFKSLSTNQIIFESKQELEETPGFCRLYSTKHSFPNTRHWHFGILHTKLPHHYMRVGTTCWLSNKLGMDNGVMKAGKAEQRFPPVKGWKYWNHREDWLWLPDSSFECSHVLWYDVHKNILWCLGFGLHCESMRLQSKFILQ